jgi:hypothetical protein
MYLKTDMSPSTEFRVVQPGYIDSKPHPEGDGSLEVDVIFTGLRSTIAAMQTASELARNLDARIRLVVMQHMPLSWSAECPPVSLNFFEERCRRIALQCAHACEVKIDVYVCWDKWQALRQALSPPSLIVIGGKRRLWRSQEQKLARRLESEGHRVVFADRCAHPPPAIEHEPV